MLGIDKLFEAGKEFIGMFTNPVKTKLTGIAKASNAEKAIALIRRNLDMKINYDGDFSITELDMEGIQERIKARKFSQDLREQLNAEKIYLHAAEQLGDDEVNGEKVDEDWVARFFNIAGEISNEEMQFIWGKVLAGEVKQPGSFSLRTLETLKNMTQEEAEIFQKVASYIVLSNNNSCYLHEDDSLFNCHSIDFSDILTLDEIGLMTQSQPLNWQSTVYKDTAKTVSLEYGNKALLLENITDGDMRIDNSVHILAETGMQLYRIIEKECDDDYFTQLLKYYKRKGLNVYYGKILYKKIETNKFTLREIKEFQD